MEASTVYGRGASYLVAQVRLESPELTALCESKCTLHARRGRPQSGHSIQRGTTTLRLMRLTPASSQLGTVNDLPGMPTHEVGQVWTQPSRPFWWHHMNRNSPGAKRTSAPARSNACKRRIVSAPGSDSRGVFGSRGRVNMKGSARAASTATATYRWPAPGRTVACCRRPSHLQ